MLESMELHSLEVEISDYSSLEAEYMTFKGVFGNADKARKGYVSGSFLWLA